MRILIVIIVNLSTSFLATSIPTKSADLVVKVSSTPPTTQEKWIAILQSPKVAKISNIQDDALRLTPTGGETTLKPGIVDEDALILTPTTGETTLKPGIVDDASTAEETTLKPGIVDDDASTAGETTLKPGIVDDDALTAEETTETLNNNRSVESSTLYEELSSSDGDMLKEKMLESDGDNSLIEEFTTISVSIDADTRDAEEDEQGHDTTADEGHETTADEGNDTTADKGNDTTDDEGNDTTADEGNDATADKGNDTTADEENETTADEGNDTTADKGHDTTADKGNNTTADEGKEQVQEHANKVEVNEHGMSKDDEPEETYRLSPNQTLRTLVVGGGEETTIDEESTTWDPEDTTYWFNHDTSDSGQTWYYAGRVEIPIWVLVIVSFLLSSCFILYMKVFQPEAWNKMATCCKSGKLFSKPIVSTWDLRRWRCPKMAAPSSSCMSKRGTCWKGICCVSSSRRTNDMCFLCLNEVPNKEWETHRRVCALRNQDKLDNLSSPSPVPCFRCNKFLRALPSYPVTSFICDREDCVHKGQHLHTKTHNRYNCYLCDFDLCSDCVNSILENTGNQERKSDKSVDEVEIVSIHHQTREIEYVEDDIPDSSLAYLTPNDSESSSTRQTRKVSKKTSTCSVEIGVQTTAFPHYRTTSFPQ